MTQGPSVRVLLFEPDRPVSRASIDWIADRQAHARVIVPSSLSGLDTLPPRARHDPFSPPEPGAMRLALEAARFAEGGDSVARIAAEAIALALLEGGAVMVCGAEIFRRLVPLSCWSMNVPERPTDGLLAQHLGIASRLPEAWRDSAIQAVRSVLSDDPAGIAALTRQRRVRARRDGPERFRRLGRTSAGLRPAVVYLDL
ncbi:MAG TPA: hypothetical protein VKF61_09490, partial [Candidatus Polarisedimenticolia bacterium]|nr:hypothetical protein [Candidatus Polarisedimenticolia bacterium]